MRLTDATVAAVRAWVRRVSATLEPQIESPQEKRRRLNKERSRAWRDRHRGRPPRPVTDWEHAAVCAMAGHPLTPENISRAPNGQRQCRICRNTRIREWRRRRKAAA